MFKKLIILTISFIIFLFSINFTSAEKFEFDELIIECEPTSLHMDYGSESTIHINIKNIYNQTEHVHIEWIPTEAFGLTQGEVSEDYFKLESGETKDIELFLQSSNRPPQSDGAEDGVIWIRWGINLSLRSWGSVDWDTVDNETMIHIDLIKFFTNPICLLGIIIIVIIIILVIVLFYKKRKLKCSPSRPEQVGEHR